LDGRISFSLSPREGPEIMPQGEKVKMSLCSPWDLKFLHHLILGFKEAKYGLSGIVGVLYLLLRKPFIEEKAF